RPRAPRGARRTAPAGGRRGQPTRRGARARVRGPPRRDRARGGGCPGRPPAAPRRDRRARRSRRRDRHPAGGAATAPPPPPSPEHGQRPPARCPSPSSWAAPRIAQRSPPSPLARASAPARRRLMLNRFDSQLEIVQNRRVRIVEELPLVLAVDLLE